MSYLPYLLLVLSRIHLPALDFDKANEILFRLGIIYKQQGKYAESLECFGLVKANQDVTAYYTLVKEEAEDPLVDLTADADADRIVASLGLDPALLNKPLRGSAQTSARAIERTV